MTERCIDGDNVLDFNADKSEFVNSDESMAANNSTSDDQQLHNGSVNDLLPVNENSTGSASDIEQLPSHCTNYFAALSKMSSGDAVEDGANKATCSSDRPLLPNDQLPATAKDDIASVEHSPQTMKKMNLNDSITSSLPQENVLDDSCTDSSSVCEVLEDDDDLSDADVKNDKRPAVKKFGSPTAPPNESELCQPSSSSALTEDDFVQQFVDFVSAKSQTNPEALIANVAQQYFNEQSRSRPLGFRKLLERGNVAKVRSVSIPPSQVVHMMAEFEPESSLKELYAPCSSNDQPLSTMYSEMTHKLQFAKELSPNFTRVLYDLGFSMALESAYRAIISKHSRNKKESTDTLERVKKNYEELKEKNASCKIPQRYRCKVPSCRFVCESQLAINIHQQQPHKSGNRFVCAFCESFRSTDQLDMSWHYLLEHGTAAVFDDPQPKWPCSKCVADFNTKNELKFHSRECALRNRGFNYVLSSEFDIDVVNKRLWPQAKSRVPGQPKVFAIPSQVKIKPAAIKPKTVLGAGAQFQQTKGIRKSVSDIVNLVSSGDGRIAPSYLAPFGASNARPSAMSTLLTMTGGQTFILRNGSSLSLINSVGGSGGGGGRFHSPAAPPGIKAAGPIQGAATSSGTFTSSCEICDSLFEAKLAYIFHLRECHKKLLDKHDSELTGPAPLACSRCKDRFYTYEGLERHLLMKHCLVTSDLLDRAHRRQDNGKCKLCGKVYAFNLLQHLVQDHRQQLCSAEILYSCDLCSFQCKSYVLLESHLRTIHAPPVPSNLPRLQNQQTAVFRPRLVPAVRRPSNASLQQPAFPVNRKRLPAGEYFFNESPSPNKMPRLPRAEVNGVSTSRPAVRFRSEASRAAAVQLKRPPSEPQQQQQASAKKTLKYCCTPCGVKFTSYDEVIRHWADRHLRKLHVNVCRIDACDVCQKTLTYKENLVLDFTYYESMIQPAAISTVDDDDLEIISEHRPSAQSANEAELICLD